MTPHRELADTLIAIILEALRTTGRYHLAGFGVWTLKRSKARRIRNPVTRELMTLPAQDVVRFHAAKKLKAAVRRDARQGLSLPAGERFDTQTTQEGA